MVDYFNDRGINFYIAGLNVAKAFDSVNHYIWAFIKLMNAHVSLCVLNTLVNWYGNLSGFVRWAGVLSQQL